jgi:deoxyribonuclease V
MWPEDADALVARQRGLATLIAPPWSPPIDHLTIGACWVCFPRGSTGPGEVGEAAWSAAVVIRDGTLVAVRVSAGMARAPYAAGLLALRTGPLLEEVVRGLPEVRTCSCSTALDATIRGEPAWRCTSATSWECRPSG